MFARFFLAGTPDILYDIDMALMFALQALVHFIKTHFFVFFANHLVNIPLAKFIGVGKYAAFCIAIVTDVIQLTVYYNVLNHTPLASRFKMHIDKQMIDEYRKPRLIERLPRHWGYIGVMLLALLPIYFGGLFVSMFTAHLLRLNKRKSVAFIAVGSIVGCYIWTIGVWSSVDALITLVFPAYRH
jgi:uncharacterized membrane protein